MLKNQQRNSLPRDTTPPAFKQHSTSPIRTDEQQEISINLQRRIATPDPTGSNVTSRNTTPREGGHVVDMRNFNPDPHNLGHQSKESEFFNRKSFKEALRDFRAQEAAITCNQVKEILAKDKKNKLLKNCPAITCAAVCVGTVVIVSLELIMIALLTAILLRQ
jgi:hypothetical protein